MQYQQEHYPVGDLVVADYEHDNTRCWSESLTVYECNICAALVCDVTRHLAAAHGKV